MAQSYTQISLTPHHKQHVLSGKPDAQGEIIIDGTHKNLPQESLMNLQLRQEDVRLSASSSVNPLALQSASGHADIFINQKLNHAESMTVSFKVRNTSATVRTNQQLTLTPYLNTGGAATADGGNYQIGTPYGLSTILAFNAAAGTVQAAIRAVDARYSSVTATGTAVTAIVVVMVGIDPTDVTGVSAIELWGVAGSMNDGGVGVVWESTISTAFSYGDEVKLPPAPLLLDSVELLIGDTKIDEMRGRHIWLNILTHLSREQRDRVAKCNGFDSSTNLSNNVLVPATTYEYHVPVVGFPLVAREFPIRNLPGAANRVHIRVQFAYGAGLLESGAAVAAGINYAPSTGLITDVQISDLEIILGGDLLKGDESRFQKRELLSRRHDYRYLAHRFTTIESTAYTALQETKKKFSLSGFCSSMFIFPRFTSAVGSNLYVPRQLAYLEIEDAGGRSLSGDYYKTDSYHRFIESVRKYPSDSFSLDNSRIYFWSPSKGPVDSLLTGENLGHQWATTNEYLRFAVQNTETDTIEIYSNVISYMEISPDGQVRAELH